MERIGSNKFCCLTIWFFLLVLRIFTLPSDLLLHVENFTPNHENFRNTMTMQILIFSKVEKFYSPPKFVPLPSKKCLNLSEYCNFYFLGNINFFRFELQDFYPRGKIFNFDNKYIMYIYIYIYIYIYLFVFLYLNRLKACQMLSRPVKISAYISKEGT